MSASLLLALLAAAPAMADEGRRIQVVTDERGFRLEVDGKPLMLRGVNWDYSPVGTNYNYSLWERPEPEIKAALDHEMKLLKAGRVNVLRVYSGMPAKWIRYVYETYGIYTVLNHTMGRYGMAIDGVWRPITDYSDERTRARRQPEEHARPADVALGQREQLRARLGKRRHREPPRRAEAGRAGRGALPALRRRHRRHQGARPGAPHRDGER
jgi:hypothetical protein